MKDNVEIILTIANDSTIVEFMKAQDELNKIIKNSKYLKQVVSDIEVRV